MDRFSRMIIVAEFAKQKPLDELARILSKVYHGGYGIEGKHGHIAAWFAEDGIHISSGHAARYISTAQVIPWTRVATRIGEMLEEGSFATNVEVAAAGAHENTLLAAGMWSVKRALSEKAREQGYLPTFHFNESLTAPDEEARIGEMLRDPDIFPTMMEECRIFAEAYQKDRSLLSYHPRPTWDALNGVIACQIDRLIFFADNGAVLRTPDDNRQPQFFKKGNNQHARRIRNSRQYDDINIFS